MLPTPLHPAVVHFPIVLSFALPFVALAALAVMRRGTRPRSAWVWVVAVAAALLVSSSLAVRTGQAEEDAVESVLPRQVLHEHEEAAEAFLAGTALVFALAVGGLVGGRAGSWIRYATVASTLAVLAMAYEVGDRGGELVYEHGAAQAYAAPSDAVSSPDAREPERERGSSRGRDGS